MLFCTFRDFCCGNYKCEQNNKPYTWVWNCEVTMDDKQILCKHQAQNESDDDDSDDDKEEERLIL